MHGVFVSLDFIVIDRHVGVRDWATATWLLSSSTDVHGSNAPRGLSPSWKPAQTDELQVQQQATATNTHHNCAIITNTTPQQLFDLVLYPGQLGLADTSNYLLIYLLQNAIVSSLYHEWSTVASLWNCNGITIIINTKNHTKTLF